MSVSCTTRFYRIRHELELSDSNGGTAQNRRDGCRAQSRRSGAESAERRSGRTAGRRTHVSGGPGLLDPAGSGSRGAERRRRGRAQRRQGEDQNRKNTERTDNTDGHGCWSRRTESAERRSGAESAERRRVGGAAERRDGEHTFLEGRVFLDPADSRSRGAERRRRGRAQRRQGEDQNRKTRSGRITRMDTDAVTPHRVGGTAERRRVGGAAGRRNGLFWRAGSFRPG
jgi:hypothetical protein